MKRVLVIGAGAAGLTAALRAAEQGARVTLLNAHPKIGLKILMSGGTRCNVTHREVTERDFNGGSRPFVARVLRAFTSEQSREWLEGLGVALKLEDTGKYFPVSDDAATVLEALVGAVTTAGVEVVAGARAVRIDVAEGAGVAAGAIAEAPVAEAGVAARARFRVGIQRITDSAGLGTAEVKAHGVAEWPLPAMEPKEWLEADAVILASGGLSFPRTGSDGTGYALAAALGHTIVPPVPALTPLAAEDRWCRELQGLATDVELTLTAGGKRVASVRGPLLITHFGYSGPAALDLSRHWLRAEGAERRVTANFAPGSRLEDLLAAWQKAAAADSRITIRRHLGELLPDRLVLGLCIEAGSHPTRALSQTPKAERSAMLAGVLARPLPVSGTLGYEKAEVTAGGVALDEVNPSTLESRRTPGLYLCGEVLDVEGRLGGFNFQWGWSSGTVAGRAAAPSTTRAG